MDAPLSRLRPAVLVTGLAFAVAGIMFAAAAASSQGTDLRAQRAVELRDLVRETSARVEALQSTVAAQQRTVDDLASGRTGDPAAAAARNEIAALRDSAGLGPVVGDALTVTLDDAPVRESDDPLWQTLTPDDVIVHQSDVQAVVNALWRGGASAIEVMDQRVISTTAIRCVGNTLLLQGRVYSPPFSITAVGPVKRMRAALRDDPEVTAYRDWAAAAGLGYQVSRSRNVTIAGYEGPIAVEHSAPRE